MSKGYRVMAKVDLDAIYRNVVRLKRLTPDGTKMCAVIKTDGYGHGAVPIAHRLHGVADWFAVATIEEAMELRKSEVAEPILILGFTQSDCYEDLIKQQIRPTIYEFNDAKVLSDVAVKMNQTARVHIKLDTGMGRLGFRSGEKAVQEILEISKLPGIEIEGMFTHFAKADEKDKTSVNHQLDLYMQMANALEEAGLTIPIRHCSNSAGIIDNHGKDLDMVRAGIVIYGLYPSDEVMKENVELEPALALKSHVVFVKKVPAGTGISYGSTFVTDREMVIATVPVGYGDGYPRLLSNKGSVLIRGMRAPILGRVCMDQFMVDVTHIPDIARGDEVTLIGKDGDLEVSADDIARLTGTISYEVVCDLGKRIPRFYVDGKKC
jgi:alanine racemase